MQAERVERVKSLLASALARPLNERDAYLDAMCGGDLDLRRDVDHYLHSGDKTEQFRYNAENTDDHQPPDPRIGREFGKYVIRKRLAEGGMGIVYLALDTQLGRDVALKILPEYFSGQRERVQRFHREARATSQLNHPNIVTVFDLGQVDGCEFIVTEFVEGETLREKMVQGTMPFVEMLKVVSQVAGALGAAHRAGVIHRDIKPENVMIRPDGYVKVLDFGLAKLTAATRQTSSGNFEVSQHTTPGMIMGTAAYMSPEQATGSEVDARTDIWALGVILYEMAAGNLPFDGPTPSHTIVAILEHAPLSFEHPSAELRQIISTALQKDKQLRFQTAEAMSSALDELKHRLGYISDQGIPAPVTVENPKAVAVKQANGSSKLLWLIPAAFAVLVVGVLGVWGALVLFSGSSGAASNTVKGNSAVPVPSTTVSAITVSPTPVANSAVSVSTPESIYVDPTPVPTVQQRKAVESTPEKTKTVAAEPTVRTPKSVEIKKKKPAPAQDPNCVFTNSCN